MSSKAPDVTTVISARLTQRYAVAMALAFASFACQNHYPLAPTLCDRWCAASERDACRVVLPAECVVACEEERDHKQRPECDAQLLQLTECLDRLSDAQACARNQPRSSSEPRPCGAELQAYLDC